MASIRSDVANMTDAEKNKRIEDLEQALFDIHQKVLTINEVRSSSYQFGRTFVRAVLRRIRCEFGDVNYLGKTNKRKGLRK